MSANVHYGDLPAFVRGHSYSYPDLRGPSPLVAADSLGSNLMALGIGLCGVEKSYLMLQLPEHSN